MYTKRYNIGPLDNIDQTNNQLYRLLDKLEREHTMQLWQETCKVADELNKGTTLERRELPIVFIKDFCVPTLKKRDYPPRKLPSKINKGTVMWWSIDDIFEVVINPGYAVFATVENVKEYSVGIDPSATKSEDEEEPYGDKELRLLLESKTLESDGSVTKWDVLTYLNDELDIFVPSDNVIFPSKQLTAGDYEIEIRINEEVSDKLKVRVLNG